MTSRELSVYHFDVESKAFALRTAHKQLGPNDILIRTTHSGICFTDVHAKEKGCGLGHEGIGFIEAVGSSVKHMAVNEQVGWGWLHTSCGQCTTCVTGYRQYCAQARGFAFSDLDQGAFSNARIIDASFAYHIPETIPSVAAAPLMCAGASVYEALNAAGTQSHHRVGVYGIGGLGHMAILFAVAVGRAVTAISATSGKRDDAFRLGADEFRDASEIEKATVFNGLPEGISRLDASPMNIDVLLVTSNHVPDLERLLPLLARRGTIVLMTIQPDAVHIPYMPFVLPGHRLITSTEASRENHIRMLEFAARKGIRPWVEEFEMNPSGLQKAFSRLEEGKMRYRGVLVK